MTLSELVPIIQLSVSPVILVSGVGLLLLSMTNRLGRLIDRARQLADAEKKASKNPVSDAGEEERLLAQVKILSKRAHKLKLAIMMAAFSVLLAALLVMSLFVGAVFHLELALFIATLFITCMTSLVGSLVLFIMDISITMSALDLELRSIKAVSQRLKRQ